MMQSGVLIRARKDPGYGSHFVLTWRAADNVDPVTLYTCNSSINIVTGNVTVLQSTISSVQAGQMNVKPNMPWWK